MPNTIKYVVTICINILNANIHFLSNLDIYTKMFAFPWKSFVYLPLLSLLTPLMLKYIANTINNMCMLPMTIPPI